MNTRSIALPLLLACAALTAACAPRLALQTPPGFAVLEEQQQYVYRAASAEGVVLAVRAEANKPKGNLDFWADVIDRELRNRGYVAEGKATDVRAPTGLAGRQARYLREDQGRKQRFWTVVFVSEGRVWIVEAGGDAERFDARTQDGIQKAIASLTFG